MMKKINRTENKRSVSESPAFDTITSADLSMSVGQTDCVKGNPCPDYHTDPDNEDEHPQIHLRM